MKPPSCIGSSISRSSSRSSRSINSRKFSRSNTIAPYIFKSCCINRFSNNAINTAVKIQSLSLQQSYHKQRTLYSDSSANSKNNNCHSNSHSNNHDGSGYEHNSNSSGSDNDNKHIFTNSNIRSKMQERAKLRKQSRLHSLTEQNINSNSRPTHTHIHSQTHHDQEHTYDSYNTRTVANDGLGDDVDDMIVVQLQSSAHDIHSFLHESTTTSTSKKTNTTITNNCISTQSKQFKQSKQSTQSKQSHSTQSKQSTPSKSIISTLLNTNNTKIGDKMRNNKNSNSNMDTTSTANPVHHYKSNIDSDKDVKFDMKQYIQSTLTQHSSKFKPLFHQIDDIMSTTLSSTKSTSTYQTPNYTETIDDTDNNLGNNRNHNDDVYDQLFNSILDTRTGRRNDYNNNIDYNDTSPKHNNTINNSDNNNSNNNNNTTTKSSPRKSIFDAFPIKPKNINPNAFEKHSFEQYISMMNTIFQQCESFQHKKHKSVAWNKKQEDVRDWLLKGEPLLDYNYTVLKDAIENGIHLSTINGMDDSKQCNNNYTTVVEKDDILNTSTSSNDKYFHDNDNNNHIQNIDSNTTIFSTTPTNNTTRKKSPSYRHDINKQGSQSYQFLQEVTEQKHRFLAKSGFDKQQYAFILKTFSILSGYCAKFGSSSSITVAWEKMKEAGIIPHVDAMNTYLYVTGTMGVSALMLHSSIGVADAQRGLSQMTNDDSDDNNPNGNHDNSLNAVMDILGGGKSTTAQSLNGISIDQRKKEIERVDLPTELALFHDLLFEPTEKSITLRVKRLVSQGYANDAEKLLDSFPTNDDVRLRTYLPVLKLYCDQGNVSSALRLFKRMRNEPSVKLEPENYILLISSLMENGCFSTNSSEIESAFALGYKHACGPELFDELMKEMADDVLEISSASARRLYNAIAEGMTGYNNKLKPILSLAGLVTDNSEAYSDELVASRVAIGETTGICPRSGVKLKLINLQKHERKLLHNGLLQLANTSFQEYMGSFNEFENGNHQDSDHAANHLNSFADWLNNREGKPFTAIIDGANVAYYMQNYEGGSFNFHQIKFMVDALEKMNENPLVILPFKYCSPSFSVGMGSRSKTQMLDNSDKEILNSLIQRGQLYRVPPRCLDDYYWMLASVSEQTVSRNDVDIDVPADNKNGRWPGARPMLISNDQMRDHKLGLLEPRLFRRWFGCYIVNYNFTAFVGKESVDREIGFSTADFFSREIQANETDSGTVWHIPVSDWKLDDRLCIKIPRSL